MNERKYFMYVMRATDSDTHSQEVCGITSNLQLMVDAYLIGINRKFQFTDVYSGSYDSIRELRNDFQKKCELQKILNTDYSNSLRLLLSDSDSKCKELLREMTTNSDDYDVCNVTDSELSKFTTEQINFMSGV
jgi:hypothetical protein